MARREEGVGSFPTTDEERCQGAKRQARADPHASAGTLRLQPSHPALGKGILFGCGALALAVAVTAPSCGSSDPYCGDGHHDQGEECDDGNDIDDDECNNNCIAKDHTRFTIKWAFNKDAAPGFTGDSCIDMGVASVEVQLVGAGADVTESDSCSFYQVVFPDLPDGVYGLTVRPLDINGNLLTNEPIETSTVLQAGAQVEVVIPPDAWSSSYTGTFFFRTLWGSADCDSAAPPVDYVVMTLSQDGVPLEITTNDGDKLDGSAEGACRPFANEYPQSANDVPFGPATFHVVGRSTSGGEADFEGTFDTFVGAGISNPELHFDVNSTAIDAGVPDAGPDAGEPDAGVDAGVVDAAVVPDAP